MALVAEAKFVCNFDQTQLMLLQQMPRAINFLYPDVLMRRKSGASLEQSAKVIRTHIDDGRDFRQAQVLSQVFSNEFDGAAHQMPWHRVAAFLCYYAFRCMMGQQMGG
jgi:hypothetical protein